jgi:hypothetical protein
MLNQLALLITRSQQFNNTRRQHIESVGREVPPAPVGLGAKAWLGRSWHHALAERRQASLGSKYLRYCQVLRLCCTPPLLKVVVWTELKYT